MPNIVPCCRATFVYPFAMGGKKGTGTICAKHPPGRSGKWCLSPFSPMKSSNNDTPLAQKTDSQHSSVAANIFGLFLASIVRSYNLLRKSGTGRVGQANRPPGGASVAATRFPNLQNLNHS